VNPAELSGPGPDVHGLGSGRVSPSRGEELEGG
jgi:hypothetical protein